LYVDAEPGGDHLDPYLTEHVGLEIELGPDVRALRLAVLGDHHEGGQEDRLQRDDQGEQPEGKPVEGARRRDVVQNP